MSFEYAPVSKGLMMACALTSILAGLFDVKHYLHLQESSAWAAIYFICAQVSYSIQFVPHISRHHQYWRLFLHHLAFASSSDLFVAELVLYNVAIQIERQFGSVKFASFALVSTLLSTIFEFITLLMFHRVGLNYIPPGPSALLFNILYQYSRIVPSAYDFRIFGVPLSNKSFIYVLAFQLAISHLPGSAAAAFIGILAGQIYRSDLANLKSYRIRSSAVRFSTRFILPLIGSTRPPRRTNRALPDPQRASTSRASNGGAPIQDDEIVTTARTPPSPPSQSAAGGGASEENDNGNAEGSGSANGTSVVREWVNELTGRTERANSGIRVPSESEVATLVGIFPNIEREVVVAALQRSPNLEVAAETLLMS